MRDDNITPQAALPDSSVMSNAEQAKQQDRQRQVHQRLEELSEERRLRRLLSDEWDD